MNKVIITVAPLAHTKHETFPTADELADELVACHAAGASVLHLHVIDRTGEQTTDTAFFKRVIDRIRSKCDMITGGSSGGPLEMTPDERSVALGVDGVEIASLNMGSANVGDGVYVNSPSDITFWAEKMKRHNVIPDMAFFEIGMFSRLHDLAEKGLLDKPYCVNLAMGFPGAIPATPDNLMAMVRCIPAGSPWTLTCCHPDNFDLRAMAIALGGNCRVGFEDSPYTTSGKKASDNGELVASAAEFIRCLGKEVATPAEARNMYGLT